MLSYSIFTDNGSREVNEDSVGTFINGEGRCFVLCDGLGGHGMGDVASQTVVRVFESVFAKSDKPKKFADIVFPAAQDVLLQKQIELKQRNKMKTTAVSFVTDKKYAYISHIGDSRLYVFNKDKVLFRTLDHSVPQMLVNTHEISEEEIRNHPDRSILLRVIGSPWETSSYEKHKPVKLKKCKAFLLCSDGFWEFINETEMCRFLSQSKTVSEWLNCMINEVKKNGEGKDMDNFSAIAVWNE